ncbi:MAG TPA: superoxide dismutase [Candidatus Paceibacterota bacterium]|nr:superoxide dismutase [Candidatus Paceibacterota bacterium]
MAHELPKLTYAYDALEPFIDARTMEIHWSKHHQTYVNKLNEAITGHSDLAAKSALDLIAHLETVPDAVRGAVRNFGGGHYNHSFFWTVMGKEGRGEPTGALKDAITEEFGGFDKFREQFTKIANSGFGSGWAWLVKDKDGKLAIQWTPNQDSPVSQSLLPVVVLDAWEHAYYLKYQNRRPEYVEAWWNVVDWKAAEKRYKGELFKI